MRLFQTLAAVCAVAVPSLVSAASASETMRVHVPFSFVLAGKQFAPGDYTFQQSDNGLVMVQGAGRAAIALSVPTGGFKTGSAPGPRFASSQNQRYLVGVQGETTRAIPVHSEVPAAAPALAR